MQRCVHLWTDLGSLLIENILKLATEYHLFIELSDMAGEDAGFQKYLEKKMRADTVDRNRLHVKAKLRRPHVIMKNFIVEFYLLPSSTKMKILNLLSKNVSYWSYTYTYFAFLYPS